MKTPKKIIITGKVGVGKTTVADRLGREFGFPGYYMDKLFFDSSWKLKPLEKSREQLAEICKEEKWILDSMGVDSADRFLSKADLVILIDSNRFLSLFNMFRRRIKCWFHPRHETPDGSNNKIYLSLILMILFHSRKKRQLWLDAFTNNGPETGCIIIKRANKKTIPLLIDKIKSL